MELEEYKKIVLERDTRLELAQSEITHLQSRVEYLNHEVRNKLETCRNLSMTEGVIVSECAMQMENIVHDYNVRSLIKKLSDLEGENSSLARSLEIKTQTIALLENRGEATIAAMAVRFCLVCFYGA